ATPIAGGDSPIKGSVKVAGAEVYVVPGVTRILEQGSKNLLPLNQLAPGQVVTIHVERHTHYGVYVAAGIQMEPLNKAVDAKINISDLETEQTLIALVLFPLVAGMVGLVIGGVEGIICRTYSRAASSAFIGLIAGLIGGVVSMFAAGIVFSTLGKIGPQ